MTAGLAALDPHAPDSDVENWDDLGVVVVTAPEPMHYYALFSVAHGRARQIMPDTSSNALCTLHIVFSL